MLVKLNGEIDFYGFIKKPIYNAKYKCHVVNYKNHNYMVHLEIARKYIPNPNNYTNVGFVNGNRRDYRLHNLYWINGKDKGKVPLNHYIKYLEKEHNIKINYENR